MQSPEALSNDIIGGIIEEGDTGRDIAERSRETAEDIRELQEQMAYQFDVTLSDPSMPVTETIDLGAIADSVEDTGAEIGEIVGGRRTEQIDGNVAGYAYQGEEGSTVIDVAAAMRPDAEGHHTVDVHMLRDIVDHEGEHEKQAKEWNAEAVDIGNGQTLDRTQVSEVGAMSVQSSIAWVSADYKQIMSFVTGLGVGAEEAREAARSGDILSLAEAIRAKRGITEPVDQELSQVA